MSRLVDDGVRLRGEFLELLLRKTADGTLHCLAGGVQKKGARPHHGSAAPRARIVMRVRVPNLAWVTM